MGKPETSVQRSPEGATSHKGKEGRIWGGIRGCIHQVLRASIRDSAVAVQTDTHQVLRQFFPLRLHLEWDREQEHLWRAPTILYHWPATHSLLSAHFQSRSKENGSLTHPRPHLGKLPSLHQKHDQRSSLLALFPFKGTNAQIAHSWPVFPQDVYSWSGGV